MCWLVLVGGRADSSSALEFPPGHPPSDILGSDEGSVNPGITRHKYQDSSWLRYGSEKALRNMCMERPHKLWAVLPAEGIRRLPALLADRPGVREQLEAVRSHSTEPYPGGAKPAFFNVQPGLSFVGLPRKQIWNRLVQKHARELNSWKANNARIGRCTYGVRVRLVPHAHLNKALRWFILHPHDLLRRITYIRAPLDMPRG